MRLHVANAPPVTGRLHRLTADSAVVLGTAHHHHAIALADVTRAEVRQRETRIRSGGRWAKRGFVVGALLGGATCMADREECRAGVGPDDGLLDGFLASSLFLGGGMSLLGFGAGVAFPGQAWTPVDMPISGRATPWRRSPALFVLSSRYERDFPDRRDSVARRPNYGYEKHLKELKQQKKKEAKLERKRLKKEEAEGTDREGETADTERGYSTGD